MIRVRSRIPIAAAIVAVAVVAATGAAMRPFSPAPPAGVADYSRIDSEIVVNASAADAWKCWSTTEGAQSFFAPKCQIEPHPGGAFEIWFMPTAPAGQRGAEDLKVLSALPGEMISFEWSAPPKFAHARPQKTWVVVTFHPLDDSHTRVRLVHLGWDEMKAKNPDHVSEWNEVRGYFENAWPMVLGWMKRRFDEGPRFDAKGAVLWKE